ncbi:MAG: HAD family phosphatase [Oscillospiraceae bacterium]|nr:HAD family phosphatase [Oscillospiraceae bacterium]
MKIKGAIFDFDGTLVDSMEMWHDWNGAVLTAILKMCKEPPEDDLEEVARPMSLMQFAEYIHERYGAGNSPEEICERVNSVIRVQYETVIPLKPGVEEFLEWMSKKGIKMCVATATDKTIVKNYLKQHGIERYFEEVFSCPEYKTSKDRPFIYEIALDYLGTKKEETVVFEDAYHCIKTAKDDGFRVIGVEDVVEECNREKIKNTVDFYAVDIRDAEKYL